MHCFTSWQQKLIPGRVIYPNPAFPDQPLTVFCDQETDGGGWIIFQRRDNLTWRENFMRSMLEYQLGFGYVDCEFWLGLNNLHILTSQTLHELRVDLDDYDGNQRWAKYALFYVGPEESHYHIRVDWWGSIDCTPTFLVSLTTHIFYHKHEATLPHSYNPIIL